jgi:hypothetical protein
MNQIKLNWANQENSIRPNNFEDENYVILNVNIEDITKHMHSSMKLDLHDPKGGKNGIGNRLERAKEHFLEGEPMDLSEVGCNDRNNVIDYTNGRHRVAAAFQLGYEYIPMFVYKENIEKFKTLVRTKDVDNEIVNFLKNKDNKPKKMKGLKIK